MSKLTISRGSSDDKMTLQKVPRRNDALAMAAFVTMTNFKAETAFIQKQDGKCQTGGN